MKSGASVSINKRSLQQKINLNKGKNLTLQHSHKTRMPLCSRIFSSNKKGGTEELGKKERKILRKILGPKKYGRECRKRNNKELYPETERLSDTIRKRRIAFYGHLVRMNPEKLTKRIFDYVDKNSKTQI